MIHSNFHVYGARRQQTWIINKLDIEVTGSLREKDRKGGAKCNLRERKGFRLGSIYNEYTRLG